MALPPGTTLGPFEILSPLGAGGMGEVYRARDRKLQRDVAIKVLRTDFARNPDTLARFSREAQLLASLNHPNIAAIYGLEDSTDTPAIIMELVEGPTLADRIARGAVPIDEALTVARQIAEALEAAHEQGIIHRDLKPANIKVRPDGTVKVLDFGLAKVFDPAEAESRSVSQGPGSSESDQSPTITTPAMTMRGMILGTAAYMSPEQAAGKVIDKRSDLWAFGVVLLEMLTGRRAFTGESVHHVLAAVLKSDPDWTALPADTPASIRKLLRRCLEKDRKRRLDSAAAARLEIDEALSLPAAEPAAPAPSRKLSAVGFAAVAGVAAIATVVTWIVTRPAPPSDTPSSRFTIVPPSAQPLITSPSNRDLALSPDGRHVVYRAGGTPAGGPLVVRALDALDTRQLGGVALARGPFFSPDSRWVGFFESGELKKISITGGTAVTLCPAIGGSRGASWGDDNTIVFATGDPATGLRRVSADGGEPVVLTTPDAARNEEDHLFPSILPGGRGVLFTITAPGSVENAQVAVLDSRSGAQKTLVRGGSHPEYVESGHLIYASAGALRAVPFDPARLELEGDPVPVVEQVLISANGAANYAVSRQGTLVYVPAGMTLQTPRSLVWVDRTGREAALKAPVRGYSSPRVSPDGTRVAVGSEGDIWIWDLTREALTRLTADPGLKQQPVWTLDSRRVIFASSRAGEPNLYVQAADGTGAVERLTTSANPQVPNSVTPDGTRVVIYEIAPKTARDLVVLPLPGASESRETRLIQTAFDEWNADVSPNGRFIAYQSNESGRPEIYVRPFPAVDAGRWVVSTSGGTAPVWAKNGRELFYLDAANALTATPVQTSGSTFSAGLPVKLFDSAYSVMIGQRQYDVSSDGKRFLMLKDKPTGDQPPAGIVVVLNWFDELNRRLRR